MFKKLLSNLPYNPSLIGQVSFYAKRMHSEEKIRKLGVVFVVLAVIVQMFAAVSKPESTLAASGNDIVPGGFTTHSQANSHCNADNHQFRTILNRYGITCADLAASTTQNIRSTDYNRKLLSLGRIPYGKAGERPQVINGITYYQRYLWAWDSGAYSTYKALVGKTKNNAPFMVLYNCGNLTVVESAPAPAPAPTPAPTNRRPVMNFSANCSAISWKASDLDGRPRIRLYIATSTVNPDTDWANKGPFVHSVNPTGTGTTNDGSWSIPSQYRNSTTRYRVFAAVSDKLPSGQMDDTNFVRASPTTGVLFGPCTQTTVPPPQPPPTPEPPTDVCPNITGTQTSTAECDVCPNIGGTQSNEAECKPCEASENNEDGASCLLLSKTAKNSTQKIENADGTMAAGGDVIIYTMSTKNTSKVTIRDFVVEENIADILDYAVVTDFNGGVLAGTIVRWPATTLSANETIKRSIVVKIKDPIPQTPVSSSDPGHFDLVMNNVYGNAINIKLPGGIIKTTEITTKALPNTGPGETLAAAVAFTVFASYFFARSRLFAKELDIVRTDYATTGGY